MKKEKPKFNYKNQGRPELFVDFEESEESDEEVDAPQNKVSHKFLLPDLDPRLKYMNEIALNVFFDKSYREKNIVSGNILYCGGLNDSYKEYVTKRGGYNLYDAI